MIFDTHCHLNFKAYKKNLSDIIARARIAGVGSMMVPGTDVKTSRKAVEIVVAQKNIYAAVGIHPHHAYKILKRLDSISTERNINKNELIDRLIDEEVHEIEELVTMTGVKAVGEVGMDRHEYEETIYGEYTVNNDFISVQKELLKKQIRLAIRYDKSLIIHNREAKHDLLPILKSEWDDKLRGRCVLHCCEPDIELLTFVQEQGMYIGVDGDITYSLDKQEFIKRVPLEILVLETDAPFLLPEPLRSQKKYPNEPSHIHYVVETVANLKGIDRTQLINVTHENACILFRL